MHAFSYGWLRVLTSGQDGGHTIRSAIAEKSMAHILWNQSYGREKFAGIGIFDLLCYFDVMSLKNGNTWNIRRRPLLPFTLPYVSPFVAPANSCR